MGEVRVDMRLKGEKGELELKDILVDTGATYTVLNKRDLEEVGAYKMRETWVSLGNKERVKATRYAATIVIGERECDTIILTFKDAERVIGLLTLESIGLKVNPMVGELEPAREANLAYFFYHEEDKTRCSETY